ncbi:hypothetical protein FW774_01565 (plasmid) [Pedobacter sp. BS3]|uniref:hypothetical protein n=1 Tax=Pedobacter sp. BS3 TaxID=2567937 RepID=UPI0011EF98A0|nr:hypothetical protein [Pedobacter sp. BS3]TZF85786.1 hypothetical protein FW774_01565 [Pedobacter sp. BS3]
MKTFKTPLLLLALCTMLLTTMTCKKDPTKNAVLPPATQAGKNTAGFILNNEVWVPYYKCGGSMAGSGSGNACGKISAEYHLTGPDKSVFDCQFRRKREKAGKSSSLTLYNRIGAKITSLGNKIDSIGVEFSDENDDNYTRLQPGSKFIITRLDTVNKIISGEFEFILNEYNGGSGKQITLKNGRFDLQMNVCLCDSK